MSLHRDRHILYLNHRYCAGELSKVLLNLPKSPLSLSCRRVPCYCYSPGGGSCGLWPWTALVPRKVGRPHRSHICIQHKGHSSETLSSKKHDIYLKDIKITYTNKNKKQYRRRLTYLSSRLARRHWHLWIPGEVNPRVWVVLNHRDLPRQPCKEIIVEGLYGPSATLSWQQCCPSAYRRECRQMSSHCHLRTETWNSLEEE
jgi:hypothetical protein